jgi:hypothetical protein
LIKPNRLKNTMNKLHAERLWPVIKAFAEGADVQMEEPGTQEWVDVPNPTFAPEIRWRVKPENEAFHAWWDANHKGWPSQEKELALRAWEAATLNGN